MRNEDYCELLDSYVRAEAENFPGDPLFQQDDAPPHTSHATRSHSADIFDQNWIGKYGPTNWPARSPDLTPLDFFLWGYVKYQVFKTPVQSITPLKRRITPAISNVTQDMITKAWENMENRLDAILRETGGHIVHL